jgi:thiamine transporter ThiT
MIELHKRTIVRTISYRMIALLITAIWTGLSDAVVIHIILTLVHYAMERVWLKIKWGRIE